MEGPVGAARARAAGNFVYASELYEAAAEGAETVAQQLHLRLRGAYCLVRAGRDREAAAIAAAIVAEARAVNEMATLCDAMSLLVDDHIMHDRLAEGTNALAEARYVLDQLPDSPATQQVIYNLAVTYERCDFPHSALELFERSLALATDDSDRSYVLAGMAVAYHLAMIIEPDVDIREQHVADGIRVTTEALGYQSEIEVVAQLKARAHRAAFYNAQGRHAEALADALAAGTAAKQCDATTELVVSLLAEAVARWRLDRDASCVDLVEEAWALATGPWTRRFPVATWSVQLEALWETGQLDRLRAALAHRQRTLESDLRRERAGRLAHVELAVAHRRTQRMSDTDPLTGLYNRRYLSQVLPEALEQRGPICVAVFDLDGFKSVNDEFSYEQGDMVIQQIATVLEAACRRGDFLGRLGGDEFVMVLCQITPEHANRVLSRITQLIRGTRWNGLPEDTVLTASVGVAVGRSVADSHRIIVEASSALRVAKQTGRDRIVFG